jgi:transcriptional regulator with XRE-family HTH domain
VPAPSNLIALPEDTRSLAARETLTAALIRAAAILKISQSELAEILGLSPASVSRMAHGNYLLDPAGKEWQLAALVVRLFRSLDSVTGADDEASRQWLRSQNSALSGVPAELVKQVSGLVSVVQYLDASRAVL